MTKFFKRGVIILKGKPLAEPGRYEQTGRQGIGGILPRGSISDRDIAEVKRWFRQTFLARIEHFGDDAEAWDRRLDGIDPPRFEDQGGKR